MAIEDGYQLALTLAERADQSKDQPMNIEAALRSYQSVRIHLHVCFLALCSVRASPQACMEHV